MSARQLPHKFVERVWGTTNLWPLYTNTTSSKIGEVWFDTVPGLPLLVKFVFTTDKLSVQVHPDDAYAQKQGLARGKTEMWHIVDAKPGAQVAAGFKQKLTPAQMEAAAKSGEIMDLLDWHEAHPGDTYFIPAGTVHAIGEGLLICEVQQESDTTYRLYDYGRPRELHLEHGMAVSHLEPADVRIKARDGVLVSCPQFTTERIVISGPRELPGDCLLIVIGGSGTIAGSPATAGTCWHVFGAHCQVAGDMTLLRSTM